MASDSSSGVSVCLTRGVGGRRSRYLYVLVRGLQILRLIASYSCRGQPPLGLVRSDWIYGADARADQLSLEI